MNTPLTVDGTLDPKEWGGLNPAAAISLGVEYQGAPVDPPAHAWVTHDGEALRVAISAPLGARPNLG
ncbi:MAG: hypothetical protein QHJ73_02285, partial [Armatimonadota bacterium]|nr:hypothetical protein [Armatimonadota bacterium]